MSESVHPLKAWRKRQGLTLEQAGAKIGLPIQSLSRFERGQSEPNLNAMRRIARATGLTIYDFGNGKDG